MRLIKQYYIDIAEGRAKDPFALLIKVVLWFISCIYGAVVSSRNLAFDLKKIPQATADVPVISIGNLTWGGSFKTSIAIFIARRLSGLRGAVVTRGYGADEVAMLKRDLEPLGAKVLVGKDRAAALATAKGELDYALLDDGFQHRKLVRDCDIVMINADMGIAGKNLIPCGSLREPVVPALKRAHAVVFTNAALPPQHLVKQITDINAQIRFFAAKYIPRAFVGLHGDEHALLKVAKDGDLACFCAIAYPAGFLKTLKSIGIFPRFTFVYPDHSYLSEREFRRIESKCMAENVKTLVITAKDRARFVYPSILKILILDVEVVMDRPDDFIAYVREVIDAKKQSTPLA